jgi:hypothetical protein
MVIFYLPSMCSVVISKPFLVLLQCDFCFVALKLPTNEDIITLQLLAELSCLQIFIQDQKQNISEIKIEGNNIS